MSSQKIQKNTRETKKEIINDNNRDERILERSKDTLVLINGWIASADSKISTSCGIISVIVAIIVFVAENILSKIDRVNGAINPWKSLFIFFAVVSMIMFILSLISYLSALCPSFFKGESTETLKRKCNIFYEDIRGYTDVEEYTRAFKRMTDKQYINDVIFEIYNNSQICSKKMHKFKRGLWFSFVCVACIIACSICYFMMYYH